MKKVDLYERYGIKRKKRANGYLEYVDGIGDVSVIVCPGGGYSILSDTEKYNIAKKYAEVGFKTYVLHYSVFPIRFPYAYLELAVAIDYLKKEDKGNKIVVVGFSAGGHLATLSATLFDKQLAKEAVYLSQKTPYISKNLRPDVVIACYPVVSYQRELRHKGSFRKLCGRKKKIAKQLSVEKLVDEQTCPIFMWHTRDDKAVPYENSVVLKESLDKFGIKNELVLFEHGWHGLGLGNDSFPDVYSWFDKSVRFIIDN